MKKTYNRVKEKKSKCSTCSDCYHCLGCDSVFTAGNKKEKQIRNKKGGINM